jgi:hypothetical protein
VRDASVENPCVGGSIPMEDPLIRCLFNDSFGGYQAAHLRPADQHLSLSGKGPAQPECGGGGNQ